MLDFNLEIGFKKFSLKKLVLKSFGITILFFFKINSIWPVVRFFLLFVYSCISLTLYI